MDSSIIAAAQDVYNRGLHSAWAAICNQSIVDAAKACISPLFNTQAPLHALNSRIGVYLEIADVIARAILYIVGYKAHGTSTFDKLSHIALDTPTVFLIGAIIADLTGEKTFGQIYVIGTLVRMTFVKFIPDQTPKLLQPIYWDNIHDILALAVGVLFAVNNKNKLDVFGACFVSKKLLKVINTCIPLLRSSMKSNGYFF